MPRRSCPWCPSSSSRPCRRITADTATTTTTTAAAAATTTAAAAAATTTTTTNDDSNNNNNNNNNNNDDNDNNNNNNNNDNDNNDDDNNNSNSNNDNNNDTTTNNNSPSSSSWPRRRMDVHIYITRRSTCSYLKNRFLLLITCFYGFFGLNGYEPVLRVRTGEPLGTYVRMHVCLHARMHVCTYTLMHVCTYARPVIGWHYLSSPTKPRQKTQHTWRQRCRRQPGELKLRSSFALQVPLGSWALTTATTTTTNDDDDDDDETYYYYYNY